MQKVRDNRKAQDMAEVRNIIAPVSQHVAIKAHIVRKFKLGSGK